jgi:hypothetical protein
MGPNWLREAESNRCDLAYETKLEPSPVHPAVILSTAGISLSNLAVVHGERIELSVAQGPSVLQTDSAPRGPMHILEDGERFERPVPPFNGHAGFQDR